MRVLQLKVVLLRYPVTEFLHCATRSLLYYCGAWGTRASGRISLGTSAGIDLIRVPAAQLHHPGSLEGKKQEKKTKKNPRPSYRLISMDSF